MLEKAPSVLFVSVNQDDAQSPSGLAKLCLLAADRPNAVGMDRGELELREALTRRSASDLVKRLGDFVGR